MSQSRQGGPGARRPAPPPKEADDRQVTAVITAGWAIAFAVVLIVRDSLPAGARWWVWTCAFGLAMGLFGQYMVWKTLGPRETGLYFIAARFAVPVSFVVINRACRLVHSCIIPIAGVGNFASYVRYSTKIEFPLLHFPISTARRLYRQLRIVRQ